MIEFATMLLIGMLSVMITVISIYVVAYILGEFVFDHSWKVGLYKIATFLVCSLIVGAIMNKLGWIDAIVMRLTT